MVSKILLKSVDVSHLKTSSIIYALFAVVVFVIRNVYRKKTRDEKEIYESKLNDILTNYDSYIQRLHGDISLDSYEFVELTSIEDLLEIKETINLPIIMIEKENLVEFVILDKSNLSYIYKLSIEERE